jgi:xanthine dehydrogenase accessory factor
MMDRRRIVWQWKRGGASALVTLVGAEGSSYRVPGAHMLIGDDGEYSGTISGGCLEAEVVRKAAWMVRDGAVVERYSTLFDDTAEIPYGLGCGGVVDLLVEPAATAECRALMDALDRSLGGEESVIATWLPGDGTLLRRAVLNDASEMIFCSAGLSRTEIERISRMTLESAVDDPAIYVERLRPPLRLFVLGAGDDARPVVTMGALLGWSVTVAEGRAKLARAERFADAERVMTIASAAELGVTARDAVVIMTHSYEQDRALLIELLRGDDIPGYIGLLGAAHRSSLLVSEAAAMLGCSIAACCERVWAPVGMDLGGDGAEAIAVAIVAEVQAWQNGRLAASRRLTADSVAEQIASLASSQYLQAECAVK